MDAAENTRRAPRYPLQILRSSRTVFTQHMPMRHGVAPMRSSSYGSTGARLKKRGVESRKEKGRRRDEAQFDKKAPFSGVHATPKTRQKQRGKAQTIRHVKFEVSRSRLGEDIIKRLRKRFANTKEDRSKHRRGADESGAMTKARKNRIEANLKINNASQAESKCTRSQLTRNPYAKGCQTK